MGVRLWIAALLIAGWSALAAPAWADEAPNPSFYLVNRATSAITKVFASPAGMPNWGSDRLSGRPIAAGRYTAIRLPADGTCLYDVRVVYATGASDERRGLDTCAIDNLSFPQASATASPRAGRLDGDPSFLLSNRSRVVLEELYVSPSGNESWGEDQLGDATIGAGGSRVIRLPPGECLYDVRVVFANGDATEKRRLNLCQITNLRVP